MANRTTLTLNIGLARNDGSSALVSVLSVIRALNDRRFFVTRMTERMSATEPTLVVTVEDALCVMPYVKARLKGVAEDLHQDCIAARLDVMRHPGWTGDFRAIGSGDLFGPEVGKWGDFNPAFFLEHDEEAACV